MSLLFEELDYRPTPIGALSLRRRRELKLGVDVFEIKLGDEFLMSSLFTESEVALARLGLARCRSTRLEIAVGGLGLGYTAKTVLEHESVGSLVVIELLDAVIDWHREGLVPLGRDLHADPRCRIVQGDFFALASGEIGLDRDAPGRRFDAVLVDIDHTPDQLLDQRSAGFYSDAGLHSLARHIKPGGVFGLWSNDGPDDAFTARLAAVFADVEAVAVTFDNPLQEGQTVTQTVYLAAPRGLSKEA